MYKHFLIGVLLTGGLAAATAAPVDEQQAMQLAKEFMNSQSREASLLKQVPLPGKAFHLVAGVSARPLYIYNVGDGQGFVIVAGDDAARPILGYALAGSFRFDEAPDNMLAWLQLNCRYVEQCARAGMSHPANEQRADRGEIVVSPLLEDIQWGQDYPFNSYCPTYTSGGITKHYYTGCVVTAATQIMAYHKHPRQGKGTKSYQFKGQTLTADFGQTVYDWDSMLPQYPDEGADEEQWSAVATLSSHFGIAVEMEYAENASGAHTMYVPAAMRDYFGYDKATTMRKRNYYSSDEWLSLIREELDAGRPVYYGATSDDRTGGHAFVCDGYDSAGFVHINWGWYGRSNGYFLINHLSPSELGEGGGSGGYNLDQEIITGIQPERGETGSFERPLYASVKVSCTDYGSSFSMMTFLSNYDVLPFNGQIAVALLQEKNVLQVLKLLEPTTHIDGFADGKTGFYSLMMRDIPKKTQSSVADGTYRVGLVFRESEADIWQLVRSENGVAGSVKAFVADNQIELDTDALPHPNVEVLNPIEPDGEVYAKGSAVFPLTLQNKASDFDLKQLVMRFVSEQDDETFWDYEYPVNVYNGSTENVQMLVNLSETMPAGNYRLLLFEKGHADHVFAQAGNGQARVVVLPASEVPLLRMTQPVVWMNDAGGSEIKQGSAVLMAVTARNYGVAGKVGVIVWLESTVNPEQRYMFLQNDVSVRQGELVDVSFYRRLPVDPGTYRVAVSYLTADGRESDDVKQADYAAEINVEANPGDVWLEAVSVDMPETMLIGESYPCKVVLKAVTDFNGKVYLRLRQYNLKNGEIAYMNPSLKLAAGEQKELTFNYKPAVKPGRYILLTESHEGSKEGVIGAYANCYRLFAINDEASHVQALNQENAVVRIYGSEGVLSWTCLSDEEPLQVEVYDFDGQCRFVGSGALLRGNSLDTCLGAGIYMIRLITTRGNYMQKVLMR